MAKVTIKGLRLTGQKYGPYVATAVIALLFAAMHFGLETQNNGLLLTLLSVSVLVTFAQLEQSNSNLEKSIDENLKVSRKITDAVIPKLFSLEECINDAAIHIQPLARQDSITVRHLGLDMHDAWSKVESMLTNSLLQINVNYQLLMITRDVAKLGEVDDEIANWCEYVGEKAVPKISKDVPRFGRAYRHTGRHLEFCAKEYVYLPFLHGFEVQGAVNICYMAICRWKLNDDKYEFDWGERTYFRIVKQNADPIQSELYQVFASTFERHWGTSTTAFKMDNKDLS